MKKEKGSFTEPEDFKMIYFSEVSKEQFDAMDMNKAVAIMTMLSDEENLEICGPQCPDCGSLYGHS